MKKKAQVKKERYLNTFSDQELWDAKQVMEEIGEEYGSPEIYQDILNEIDSRFKEASHKKAQELESYRVEWVERLYADVGATSEADAINRVTGISNVERKNISGYIDMWDFQAIRI